jgi:hypothetical protein
MDWPLAGALSGLAVVVGLVAYETTLLQAGPPQAVSTPAVAPLMLDMRPLFTANPPGSVQLTPDFPAEDPFAADSKISADSNIDRPVQDPVKSEVPYKKEAPYKLARLPTETKPPPVGNPGGSGQPLLERPADTGQWVVRPSSTASYFNLGGHINHAGIVDTLASSYLKEAFKAHKNFQNLPIELKVHIANAQNINLTKIAPYRSLLGMDDVRLEQEQGIIFERIAQKH